MIFIQFSKICSRVFVPGRFFHNSDDIRQKKRTKKARKYEEKQHSKKIKKISKKMLTNMDMSDNL